MWINVDLYQRPDRHLSRNVTGHPVILLIVNWDFLKVLIVL